MPVPCPRTCSHPLPPPLHSLVALLASITYLGLNRLGTAGGPREYFARGGMVWGAVVPVVEDFRLYQEVHP